jgi:hypothetical protein
MDIIVLGVRYANDLEFFQAFTDPEDADQLKKDILANHPEEVLPDDVVITSIKLTIKGSLPVYLEGEDAAN